MDAVAEVVAEPAPNDITKLTGRARRLANLRVGTPRTELTRADSTTPERISADLRRLLGVREKGKTWSERVAKALLRAAAKGNPRCAELVLDRTEGPLGVQGKGNLTINVQGTVHIGAPVRSESDPTGS